MKKLFIISTSIFILTGCSVKHEIVNKVEEKITGKITANTSTPKNQTSAQINISAKPEYNEIQTPFARPIYNLSPQEVKMAENGCNAGDKDACGVAAMAYFYGNGVNQDTQKALSYAKKGCEFGNDLLCEKLGDAYKQGVIVKKDLQTAKKYYKKACNLGDEEACEKLKK